MPKLLPLLFSAWLTAAAISAPLQYNGDYSAVLGPYTGPSLPVFVGSQVEMTGPSGTRTFLLTNLDISQVLLSNTGFLYMAGASIGDEFLAFIDYSTTPVDTPLFLYLMGKLPLEPWEIQYPRDYGERDNSWTPIITIRNETLIGVLRGETRRPDLPQYKIFEVGMAGFGPAPIPEPATLGLFAAGCAVVVLMRRRR